MGKKVIPEVVSYFCDVCKSELKANYQNDFVLSVIEVGRDFSGSACADMESGYQLCDSCGHKLKTFLNGEGK